MTWLTILLLACITFTTRYLFLERRLPVRLSPAAREFLSFSGPAVLTSITVPILLVHNGKLDMAFDNPYLWGALAAILTAQKTGSIYWIMGIGLAVFFAVQQL